MGTRTTIGILAASALLLAVSVRAQEGKARSTSDGVYTEPQLQRGDKLYADNCSSCHGAEMKAGAGAPSLAGPEFTFGWDGKSLGSLFDFMRMNMPPGQAGGL